MTKKSIGALSVFLLVAALMLLSPIALKAQEQNTCEQQPGQQKYWLLEDLKLPDAIEKKLYTQKLEHKKLKELKNLEWNLSEGEEKLPGDLAVAKNGILTGTPVLETDEAKTYKFNVTVTEKKDDKEIVCYSFHVSLKVVPEPAEQAQDFDATETLRVIAGYELIRASSESFKTREFIDVYGSMPLPLRFNKKVDELKMRRCRVWGNIRLTSVPVNDEKTIGALSTEYLSGVTDLKLNQIAQAAEILGGLDVTFCRLSSINSKHRYTMGAILALGAIIPFNQDSHSIEIYEMNEAVQKKYAGKYTEDELNKQYVAFDIPKTNRFYRQYYAGLRFKTYLEKENNEEPDFPAMLDFTFGMNSSVLREQRGFSNRTFFRIDGFLPFRLAKNLPIYFFCTFMLNTSKGELEDILRLKDAPEDVTLLSNDVLIISEPEKHRFYSDRDYYRIGIGIDLAKLFLKTN